MSRRIREVEPRVFVGATAASALLVLGLASAASATKIYTCVNKGGPMRLVGAKAKCKHGERKVSWNTSGPAGAPGATGAAGSPGASDAKAAVFVGVICELVDTSGTVGIVELPQALDLGEWQQQLSNVSGTEYVAATTLAMQAQLTTTEPTTLAIVCLPVNGSKEAKFFAVASQLSALQTTANK
jgi:hypothetical protein